MDYFNYKNGILHAEDVSIEAIVKQYQSPCYIYSKRTIERHWHAFDSALGNHQHLVCYAVKASSNLAILDIMQRLGSGFDVVSGGELYRVIAAGGDPSKTIFSGVGKSEEEINYALEQEVLCINVESEAELHRIQAIAKARGEKAPVSLRINPDVDAFTHPYISTGLKDNKFGIEYALAKTIYLNHKQYPNLNFVGLDCHIGSQLTSLTPFLEALDKLLQLADELLENNLAIEHLDLGGGLGVIYDKETPPLPDEFARAVSEKLENRPFKIIIEPGRAIMANAGILVSQVEYIKPHHDKHFAVVDAAMNDLLRPALYQAYQTIIPVKEGSSETAKPFDIVGPVCESGDFLGHNREMSLTAGDLIAVRGSGAYGFAMSSNYNTRPRVPEILVDGDKTILIRRRETYQDLVSHETRLP